MRGFNAKRFGATALGVAVLALAQIAQACPPPPPLPGSQRIEGESDAAYRARLEQLQQAEAVRVAAERHQSHVAREAWMWLTAAQVVVVRISGISQGPFPGQHSRNSGTTPVARLQVLERSRGQGSDRQFQLSYAGDTSCGPYGPIRLHDSTQGQLFVVFAREGRLGMDTVIEAVREDEAVDPATLALFAQARAR
jgi:hypothetical protein